MLRKYWGHCLIGVAIAVAVALLLGVAPGTIFAAGVAFACPLMMVLMMGGMGHAAHRHVQGQRVARSQESTPAGHDGDLEQVG